jgi:hypothetical protein
MRRSGEAASRQPRPAVITRGHVTKGASRHVRIRTGRRPGPLSRECPGGSRAWHARCFHHMSGRKSGCPPSGKLHHLFLRGAHVLADGAAFTVATEWMVDHSVVIQVDGMSWSQTAFGARSPDSSPGRIASASQVGPLRLMGGIGVMNIVVPTVRERTRSIGIRLDIMRQFMTESSESLSVSYWPG